MEYITATVRKQVFYIEKSRAAAVVQSPEIYRVPGADKRIAGLSFFEEKLVVYYQLGEAQAFQCGILLEADDGKLFGVLAENAGVQEMNPEALSVLITGVWVEDVDKIE